MPMKTAKAKIITFEVRTTCTNRELAQAGCISIYDRKGRPLVSLENIQQVQVNTIQRPRSSGHSPAPKRGMVPHHRRKPARGKR